MLRLTNWFVGDIFVTETQSTLTLQNIAYPDFQNMNNLLYWQILGYQNLCHFRS